MDSELVARDAGQRLQQTLVRLSSLATGLGVVALLVGAATFATGWWVFDASTAWLIIGGVLCTLPVLAAAMAWLLMRSTARQAPALVADIREFVDSGVTTAKVLLDHDSGQPIGGYVKSFGALRSELTERRKDLPALFAGVQAITRVPGLAALTVLGIVGVGLLGTVLLIGGIID
ncbi:MAG TPA: hypothetical protein DCR14_15820 [Acidimicrobiaceae bacterium]|nr:hypothetical protein [Acidimicrobiaceae bacterium]